jgi:hypothetical protein
MIIRKYEVVIIISDGANDNTVIKSNSCNVTETSPGLLDVPTFKPILGKGIDVACCA